MTSHPGKKTIRRLKAGGLCDQLCLFDERESGNALNTKLAGDVLPLVRVDFHQDCSACSLGGGFGKFRRHHLAGAAPWGPEIHQDRQFALSHERGEVGRTCDLDRFSHEGQLSFAGAAAALQGGLGVMDAVGCAAGRAWQNDAPIIGGQVGVHKGKWEGLTMEDTNTLKSMYCNSSHQLFRHARACFKIGF